MTETGDSEPSEQPPTDEATDPMFRPEVVTPVVDLVAKLADGGPALELGIGSGRIALPLAARGVSVHGIDLSEEAVAELRAKPGADGIGVTMGDFSTTRVPSSFKLAYVVWNTIMNVTTQAGQVATFRNAAAHLEPGGRFLMEVMIPELRRLPPGETVRPFHFAADRWGFDEYDVVNQGLVSHHLVFGESKIHYSSGPFRYVWPAELDLMAELAGMQLEDRWEDCARAPFTSESHQHVSVWRVGAS